MSARSQGEPTTEPTESTVQLRVREAWGEYLLIVCLVGVVLLGAGVWLASGAVAEGGETTEQRTVQVFEASGTFGHQATVQRGTRAFSSGETLSGRSLYYTSITPVVNGTHRVSYTASGDAELDVETQARLIIREVDGETVLWQVSEVLASESTESLEPGETARTTFSVNVTEIGLEAGAIRDDLGASPGSIESTVVVNTRLDGTVDDRTISRTMDGRFEVVDGGSTYQVKTEESTVTEERTETVIVESEPSASGVAGGGALAVIGIAVLVASAVGRYRSAFELTAAEEHAMVRTEFEEWISTAAVPAVAAEKELVEVSSLEGLVDLAIDTDGRVVRDIETGRYVLLTEEFEYRFTPAHLQEAAASSGEGDATGSADVAAIQSATEQGSSDSDTPSAGSGGQTGRLWSLFSGDPRPPDETPSDVDEAAEPDSEAETQAVPQAGQPSEPSTDTDDEAGASAEESGNTEADRTDAHAEPADAAEGSTADASERPTVAEEAPAGQREEAVDAADEPAADSEAAALDTGAETPAVTQIEGTPRAVSKSEARGGIQTAVVEASALERALVDTVRTATLRSVDTAVAEAAAVEAAAVATLRAATLRDLEAAATDAAALEAGIEVAGSHGSDADTTGPAAKKRQDGSDPDAGADGVEAGDDAEELSGPFEGIPVVSGSNEEEPDDTDPDSGASLDDIQAVGETDDPESAKIEDEQQDDSRGNVGDESDDSPGDDDETDT